MGRKLTCQIFKKLMIACLFSTAGNFLYAQHAVTGTLTDSDNIPVENANVLLFQKNKFSKFTYSDAQGNFRFDSLSEGDDYMLRVTSMTYKDTSVRFILKQTIHLNLKLSEKIESIGEVLIEIEKKIRIQGDTIIFKADAFRNRKNAVVEDLLRNIPGIEITANGRIKFQGRLVTNVKIDDDDLFEGGYAILTKNLNADFIDEVEVLQNYNRNPLLKNVRDTEDVALNLTLKPEKKTVLFGNIDAAYSDKDYHQIKANGISFLNKSKHYSFLNSNNVGEDLITSINDVFAILNDDESYNLGRNARTLSFVNLNTRRPVLNERLVNLNNTKFASLNSIFTLYKKIKLKTSGILFSDSKDYLQNNITTILTGDPFEITEDFSIRNTQKLGFFRLNPQWYIDKNNRLEYIGSIYAIENNGRSNLSQNGQTIEEDLKGNLKRNDHLLHYTSKLKDSTAVVVSARYLNESRPQRYEVTPYIYGDFFSFGSQKDSIENSISSIQNKLTYRGIQVGLIKNSTDFNLESYLGVSNKLNKFNSRIEFNKNENILQSGEEFNNHLDFQSVNYYLKNRFRKTFYSVQLFANVDFNYEKIDLINQNEGELDFFFYMQADINLKYNLNKKHAFLSGFQLNQQTTEMETTIPNFIQISYRGFFKGLGRNEVLDNSKVFLDYRFGNWSDVFTANLNLNYQRNSDYLSNLSLISPSLSQVEQILLANRNRIRLSASADRYLNFLSSNLKLKMEYVQSDYADILNNNIREINSSQSIYGFELRSAFSGHFNINTGITWNKTAYELNDRSVNVLNNKSFLDVNLEFGDNFSVFIENERYYFGNLPKNERSFYFTSIDARYAIQDNKIALFFKVNNLFNYKSFELFSLTDTARFVSRTQLIPRYLMVGFNYRF